MKLSVLVLCLAFALAFISPAKAALDCTICTAIVTFLESVITANSTESELIQKLDNYCTHIPIAPWVKDCQNIVTNVGPAIIQAVLANEPPQTVCKQVGLCTSAQVMVGGEVECGVCAYVVSAAENYIKQNYTTDEILAMLEKDCAILGHSSWVTTCQGAIATFGPEIISLVLDKQPADVVCAEIGMCNKSKIVPSKPIALSPPIEVSTGDTIGCTLCELAVKIVEDGVLNNKTMEEILQDLDKFCAALPKGLASECNTTVEEYGPIIIKYIMDGQTPETVCTEITLCNSALLLPLPKVKLV